MKKALIMLLSVMLLFGIGFSLTSCKKKETPAKAAEVSTPAKKFKVAFIYIGLPGDLGWTYEQDQGRKMIDEKLGDKVETTFVENVPEGPDASRIIRQYAQKGYNMIFATSFGYMDPMVEVASEFPNVYFEHCSGYKTSDNMSTYFGRMYQARYLSGIVAGKAIPKGASIGYVAAFPIPEVVRGINAFTIGVRKVNPTAKVKVVWTNTWYDPVKEREAAVALLDSGVKLIAQHQDTTEPQKAAKERGLVSIGYDSDMGKFVGDSVLVSPKWHWGSYFVKTVQNALDGTWKKHSYWGGLKDGVVMLSSFSDKVPQSVRDLVAAEKKKIVDGSWDVFWGPVKGQDGKVIVADGAKMSDGDMLGMNFLVQGVVGTISK